MLKPFYKESNKNSVGSIHCHLVRWKAYPATAYPGFHSIKPQEEKLFFLGGMKLYNRVAPLSLYIIVFYRYFISAYLYPWVKEAL